MFWIRYYKNLAKNYVKFKIRQPEKVQSVYLSLGIVNPSIGTGNLGDYIIMDAISAELQRQYPFDYKIHYPSQLFGDFDTKYSMSQKDYLFVCGTNLLSSNMDVKHQWKIDPLYKMFIKNKALLIGVGWWQYQDKPNNYTKKLYGTILNKECIHSVRDSYSEYMLKEAGIENVVNTTCPTLWTLNEQHCASIPKQKARNVITTLTHYKKDYLMDRKLLEILLDKYETVYLWVQGMDDISYMKELSPKSERVKLVHPVLDAYDDILSSGDIEYVGTRLHAGVRALQKGVRTQIIAVDNRAEEIGKDTSLNVVKREHLDEIFDFIDNDYTTKINLPVDNIRKWRDSLPKTNVF